MEQVRIDFLVAANMSSMSSQLQGINAELMRTGAAVAALNKGLNSLDVQTANRQFGQLMTSSGQFTAQTVTMRDSTTQFADALNRAKLTGRQYYTESMRYLKGQRGAISMLAAEQVRMQNSIVQPIGRNALGQMQASVYTPTGLPKTAATDLSLANKRFEIFNKLSQQGATHMVNWGKNTQWAGRQLMVGFTVPMMMLGGLAAKAFKDLDEELVRLQKVYGSGLTFGDEFAAQSKIVREAGIQMAQDMAQSYGQAGTETVALMADLAAIGLEGEELAKMTEQTTRLSVLGEVDRQESMKATVAMQSAFKMSTDEVAESVLFLNAVENATSATLNDLVEAIPRAGTVVQGLGGNMEDLALYMVAMREGGISAAEGANALKSGLSSVIAPPKAAVEFLNDLGINLPKIVDTNAGDLTGTLLELQKGLAGLDGLSRQRAITTLFGKYQFARMNAFFNNLGAAGSQTQDVLRLTETSVADLAKTADQELEAIAESVSGKWTRAWEEFKISLSGAGEEMMKWGTRALSVINSVFGFISDNSWLQGIIKYGAMALTVIGPIIMVMGLFGNMVGMITKGVLRMIAGFKIMSSGGGIAKSFTMLTADSLMLANGLGVVEGEMYDHARAEQVVAAAAKEWATAMVGVTAATESATAATLELISAATGLKAVDKKHVPVQSGVLNYLPGMEGGTQRAHLFPKAGSSDAYYKTIASAFPGMTPDQVRQTMASGGPGGKPATMNFGRGFQMFPGSIAGNQGAGNAMPIFGASPGGGAAPVSAINPQAPVYSQADYARITATQTAIHNNAPLKKAAVALNASLIDGNTDLINANRIAFQKAMTEEVRQQIAATQAQTQAIIDKHMALYAQGVITAEEMFLMSHREAAAKAGYTPGFAGAGSQGIGTGSAKEDYIYAESLNDDSLRLYAQDLDSAAVVQRQAAESVSAASNDFVAGLGLADGSAKKMQAAMESAASSTNEMATITMRQIEMEGRQYAVAMDQAGNVIRESSFAISASGRAGVGSSARALTDTQFANLGKKIESVNGDFDSLSKKTATLSTSVDKETASTTRNTAATDINTKAELTNAVANDLDAASEYRNAAANDADSASEYRNAAANNAATAATTAGVVPGRLPGGTVNLGMPVVPPITSKPGLMSRMISSPKASMYAGGALMGGAMMGSMLLPEGGASNIANMSMMGAGVGGMFGPWGLAIGGVAGLITGGLTEAFKAAAEESEKRAAEAAANWELEFGALELDKALATSLGIKSLEDKIKINIVPIDDTASVSASDKVKEAVATNMTEEIDTLKQATGETEKLAYARRLYNEMIAAGNTVQESSPIIAELLRQSGNEELIYQALQDSATTEKEAIRRLGEDIDKQKEDLRTEIYTALYTGMGLAAGTEGSGGMLSDTTLDKIKESAGEAGVLWAQEFSLSVAGGFADGNAKDIANTIDSSIAGIVKDGSSSVGAASLQEMLTNNPEAQGFFEEQGIQVEGRSYADVMDQIARASNAAQQALIANTSAYPPLQGEIVNVTSTTWSYINAIKELDPELAVQIDKYLQMGYGADALSAALDDATRAQRALNREQSFMDIADDYIPENPATEEINLDKLAKEQEKEIANLQESEEERLENLQDAADKRERLIQREIDQTQKQYDKEISKIQEAEEARQEAFANEEKRAQRRLEMRNMEISYQEAIANGALYEAARIRMNIAAVKKQRDREDKAENSQDQSDEKVEILEKESEKKAKLLEKQLRQEQRANEKSLEAAQEASEAKIALAEKTNRIELADAKAHNKSIEDDVDRSQERMKKMYDAFMTGNLERFNNMADKLKIDAADRSKLMAEFTAKEFGFLPDKILNAITRSIANGNWSKLGNIMNMAANGASPQEIKDQFGWAFNRSPAATGEKAGIKGEGNNADALATGGFVSGPGSGTSDSISARLSNGEYVIRQNSVAKYGKGAMDAVNQGNAEIIPKFAEGGMVGPIVQALLQSPMAMLKEAMAASGSAPGFAGSTSATAGKPGEYAGTFFNAEQLKNAAIIAGVGKSMGANKRDILTALATAMTESTLHNYKTAVDHDSLGLFQQRPSMGWGTPEQLTDPKYASRKFYQALFGISNRDQMSIGDAAQDVQVSAYPDRYQEWVDEARAILKSISYKDKYVKPWMGSHGYSRTFGQHGGEGVDISMPTGTPLRAVTGGRLTNQPFAFGSYGNWYTLDNDGLQFVYAHLDRDKAGSGPVSPGDIIGYSGNTGNSFGAHLHFEARRNGLFSDQMDPARLGIPGLRSGGRINYDNTLANLHRGETVLTRQLSDKFENNVASAGGNTYNFDVSIGEVKSEVDLERAFERFVVRHENRQAARNGRGRRI